MKAEIKVYDTYSLTADEIKDFFKKMDSNDRVYFQIEEDWSGCYYESDRPSLSVVIYY